MSGLVLLDDGRGDFGPMTDLRASFELRSGILTTAERIGHASDLDVIGVIVPDRLAEVMRERHPNRAVNEVPDGVEPVLVVNGRLLDPPTGVGLTPMSAELDAEDGSVRRALLDSNALRTFLETGSLPDGVSTTSVATSPMARFAWDVFTTAGGRIAGDLEWFGPVDGDWSRLPGGTAIGDHPIRIASSAFIGPLVVLDARQGPVVVGPGVEIGSHAVLQGPCVVHEGSKVTPHAFLKANTVIGPGCRVGGEVGGTVFQGFANKSHEGHLGDAYVGEWVNLGAGTTNSNLLNTYGEVTMRLDADGPRLRSGRQFLGCILGDHVKTAIGTRIMTGTVIGTGAMIAGSTPPASTVARFAWVTDDGVRSYRLDKFLDVAETVTARRGLALSDAVRSVLGELHAAGQVRT